MKNLFLALAMVTLCVVNGFASTNQSAVADSAKYDTDPVLKVYMERVADSRAVQLVFANESNETVTLYSQFRSFCEKPTSPGFRLWYYKGGQMVEPECAQLPLEIYTIDAGKVSLAPHEKKSFKVLIGDEEVSGKLGLEMELRYRYIKQGDDELYTKFVRTKYIEIDLETRVYIE